MAPIASISPETWPTILSLDMVEAKIPGPWVVWVGGLLRGDFKAMGVKREMAKPPAGRQPTGRAAGQAQR